MRWVSRAAQVRELDRRVIEDLGLPGVALMELAARGVADAIRDHHLAAAARGVVVVCGSGNNGGDGWAVARWLHGWGLPVSVWAVAEPRPGGDAAVMAAVCRAAGVPEVDGLGTCGLIADAVLGTGLDRPVAGRYAEVLGAIADHEAEVVAIDIPSGLSADRGEVLGVCPPAARTVTFGRPKLGFYGVDGPDHTGLVDVVDIGLDAGRGPLLAAAEVPGAADLAPLWPTRGDTVHKGASGHLAVIAGSTAMAGAAILTCTGALAAGAGLVTLIAPRGALARLGTLPPAVMWLDGGGGDRLEALPDLGRFTAIAAGPGLGGGVGLEPAVADALAALWATDPRPMVFDADALPCTGTTWGGPRVLTPHPGEAARLLGCDVPTVQRDRFAAAERLAERGVAVLKGPHSLVASGEARLSIDPTVAPALATGGSGDVLCGVIAALLARGCPARDAARLGVWVHGEAGRRLGAARAEGWTATDIAAAIPDATQALTGARRVP